GRPEASDADVERALAAAAALEFVRRLPDGIATRVGENGARLSGGERLRIGLARVFVAEPEVVVLDEPTAQLDVRGEAEIFDRILAATRHCTTILISHRFSTVRHADRICVLEGGRVVELGSHAELMALGGRYRTMFDLQASRFATEDAEGVAYDRLG
ncbi:MAG TPA: ATP-binding cassette domain-containing protein, partial [Actinomycetes bacterium]|nr:ATP-binding cassette domain-containing protein [Actinomycetes bacterium]